jgi:hypothetical protein
MNPDRFDDLTKALASSHSRRGALKTITAATIGSILGLAGIGTAFASGVKCGDQICIAGDICCNLGHGAKGCFEGPKCPGPIPK